MSLASPPQPQPRHMDPSKAGMAFSSNNPFRASTVSSPFDEDDSPPPAPPTARSSSTSSGYGGGPRPFSFMPADERPGSHYSTHSNNSASRLRQTILFNDNNDTNDNNNTNNTNDAFSRRQYNTQNSQRNQSYRKSTNPFLEDMMSTSPKDSSTTTTKVAPPARPSNSTKPGRPRANSDSSVIEPKERERRERRERERERKHSASHHHKKDKKRSSKKKVHTDTIDKLDVTGFFGPGSFHHDGPFDACNPNRNKNSKKAPVKAFPADGANMAINGVDLRGKHQTEDQLMGRNLDEAYLDYNKGGKHNDNYSTSPPAHTGEVPQRTGTPRSEFSSFDSNLKNRPVHGELTWGLGSSTYMDGTPASRAAIEQSMNDQAQAQLGRKKSLVQRLRGSSGNGPGPAVQRSTKEPLLRSGEIPIQRTSSNPDAAMNHHNRNVGFSDSVNSKPRVTSAGEDSGNTPPAPSGNGLLRRVKSLKVGSRRRAS